MHYGIFDLETNRIFDKNAIMRYLRQKRLNRDPDGSFIRPEVYDDKGIPWGEDRLNSELYALCKSFEPKPEYKIDKIAEAAGHQILRTPQYHPELQPIEMCWGVMKNFMAKHCDFTLQKLRKNLPRVLYKLPYPAVSA